MHKSKVLDCKGRMVSMIIRLIAVFLLFLIPNLVIEWLAQNGNRNSYTYTPLIIAIAFIVAMAAFSCISFVLMKSMVEKSLLSKRILLRSAGAFLLICLLIFATLYFAGNSQSEFLLGVNNIFVFSAITQIFFVVVESVAKGGAEAVFYMLFGLIVGIPAAFASANALTGALMKTGASQWKLAVCNTLLWVISYLVCTVIALVFDLIATKVFGGKINEA